MHGLTYFLLVLQNHLMDVMVGIIAMSAVDCEFDPLPDQNKDIKLVFAASPLSTQHKGIRKKTNLLEVMIMCQNGRTCLPVDLFFSELPSCCNNPTLSLLV